MLRILPLTSVAAYLALILTNSNVWCFVQVAVFGSPSTGVVEARRGVAASQELARQMSEKYIGESKGHQEDQVEEESANLIFEQRVMHHPSALRNRAVITDKLSRWLGGTQGKVLEVASGTGCHVESFARALPRWTWQPSEYDRSRILDVKTTVEEGRLGNVLEATPLDVRWPPSQWPQAGEEVDGWDAMVGCNMIHIAPKDCTEGLMLGAGALLRPGGHLFLYGPFALAGLLAPESNVVFDQSLKARSRGQWGVRDITWVAEVAARAGGMELTEMTAMPANNYFVVFTKVGDGAKDGVTASAACNACTDNLPSRIQSVVMPAKASLLARMEAEREGKVTGDGQPLAFGQPMYHQPGPASLS
ncbi:unnamed protein product [Discosporangium mesarthrocarpum]